MPAPGTQFAGPLISGPRQYADNDGPANTGLAVLSQAMTLTQNSTADVSGTFTIPEHCQILDFLVDNQIVWNAAVSASLTIGTVALGEVAKRGYSERLFLGTIAAGGTLRILIPPSINMIVYGVLTETSIPKLYLAGFIPGIVLASLFSLTVLLICVIKPSLGGKPTATSWKQRIAALPDLIPPLVIFLAVIGSIYAGWATAPESAALGVIAAIGIAAANPRPTLRRSSRRS